MRNIAIIGGSSLVGQNAIEAVVADGANCIAFTRKSVPDSYRNVEWRPLSDLLSGAVSGITDVICVTHIWIVPEYLEYLAAAGVKRLVAISSTSRFTKQNSDDLEEVKLAQLLEDSELLLAKTAVALGMSFTILRPTLIYGEGKDNNVAEVSAFLQKFGFFPLFGKANGLRQPIHARDVAGACLAALGSPQAANKSYNITGSETLPYHDMVRRIASAKGLKPRFPRVPILLFKVALSLLRLIPRYAKWTPDMAMRMNRDLVFDSTDAFKDFGFRAGKFDPLA